MTVKKILNWIHDYIHLAHKQGNSFIFRKPPSHYLGHIVENKAPIILIPGVYEKWQFLKTIADPISLRGYPVYVLDHLGYNVHTIDYSAKLVRELINEKELRNVIIIAHSKGGLIAKYLLAYNNQDGRVAKVITIATPFHGVDAVKLIPNQTLKEFHPESDIIKKLESHSDVNCKITSIFGEFDNHVWPVESCNLEGAKNIRVETYGHHKILFNKKVCEIVLSEVEKV